MLDTLHPVQTPEGVDLSLPVAGPVARGLAWMVDTSLTSVLLMALFYVVSTLAQFGTGVGLIGLFLVFWFYPVVFEVYAAGQTPGKKLMGLRVVHEDGTPVGWNASVLRNLLRTVDFLPMLYVLGLLSMLIDSSFRRLGDLAAGTVVVYTEGAPAAAGAVPEAAPLAPPISLELEEQRAVIAFAERAPFLTVERAAELAAIPAPLVEGGDAPQRLMRMAAWLLGRHL